MSGAENVERENVHNFGERSRTSCRHRAVARAPCAGHRSAPRGPHANTAQGAKQGPTAVQLPARLIRSRSRRACPEQPFDQRPLGNKASPLFFNPLRNCATTPLHGHDRSQKTLPRWKTFPPGWLCGRLQCPYFYPADADEVFTWKMLKRPR